MERDLENAKPGEKYWEKSITETMAIKQQTGEMAGKKVYIRK